METVWKVMFCARKNFDALHRCVQACYCTHFMESMLCALSCFVCVSCTRVCLTVLWPCINVWCPLSILTVFSTLNISRITTHCSVYRFMKCRIESNSLQCNMFVVYRTTEVHFIYCARLYWLERDCLLMESVCQMLCRLRSVLSASLTANVSLC